MGGYAFITTKKVKKNLVKCAMLMGNSQGKPEIPMTGRKKESKKKNLL